MGYDPTTCCSGDISDRTNPAGQAQAISDVLSHPSGAVVLAAVLPAAGHEQSDGVLCHHRHIRPLRHFPHHDHHGISVHERELTTDYNERTSLATTRMVFSVVGYISGAALTTLLAAILRDSNGIPIRRLGAKSV